MAAQKSGVAVGLIVLAVLAALCTVAFYLQPPLFWVIDLPTWRRDWPNLWSCLGSGTACESVSKFPAGYLLNSLAVAEMWEARVRPKTTMLAINAVFLSMPIVMMWTARGTDYVSRAAPVYCAALLLSPLPAFYVYSGALEVQSGVAMGLFLAAVLLGSQRASPAEQRAAPIFLVISAFLFPLYKDTNLAVIAFSLGGALVLTRLPLWKAMVGSPGLMLQRRTTLLSLSAIGSALLSIFLMNYAKYSSVLPAEYLDIRTQTSPSLMKSFEFLVATIFSPAGGVLAFWTAAFVLVVVLVRFSSLRLSRRAALVSSILVAGFAAGNSLWWASFGWFAWGNRFMVAPMLAALICITVTAVTAEEAESDDGRAPNRFADIRSRPWVAASLATVALACSFSLYYVYVSYYENRWDSFWAALNTGPECARMDEEQRGELGQRLGLRFWRTEFYYACARERFLHVP